MLCYGQSADEAVSRAKVLTLRAIADPLEHGETKPVAINILLPLAA